MEFHKALDLNQLSSICTSFPANEIIWQPKTNVPSYADDTQLYLPVEPEE